MNKIKVIGLGLFFSLFFVACGGSSSSSPTPGGDRDGGGERVSQNLSPKSLSFTYGETSFKTLEVTSDKAGKGKYSVTSSNNKAVATAISNSVGLVRVTPIGVGDAIITVKREGDASYDSAETEIAITVKPQEQNLKVNLGTSTSDRWKLSKYATATISIAARSVGGVGGDGDLVGSTASYSIKKIESSTTGDQKPVVAAKVEAGEIIITATSTGDATVTVSNGGGDNYNAGEVVIFITVNNDATQAALNFTSTDGSTTDADVTYDSYAATVADKNITVAGGSAGNFVVKSSNTEIVTADVDTNGGLITITPLSAGTAVITVTRKGGVSSDGVTTYNPISKDIRVSVNKPAAQTLTLSKSSFTEDYNKLDDTGDSMASGSSSTGDYYIKSSKPGVATASITASGAITVVFEQVGTTDITITRAGDYDYRLSSAATIDVKITKATQTLMAPPSSISATYTEGTDTTSITITGGKGTGSFDTPTSSTPDVATASITESGTLTVALNLGGTTNITVRKRGDRNYEDSDPLEIAVTIKKAPHAISIFGGETSFQQQLGSDPVTVAILGAKGEGIYTEPIVVSTPVAPVVASASIAGNELTLTVLELGSAVVTFRKNGDRNYANSNEVTIDVEVTTQANQVLTLGVTEVTGLTVTYEDAEVTGLTVTYQDTISADVSIGTDATGTGNAIEARSDDESVARVAIIDATSIKITFVDAGETTIFVSRAGNANFNPSRAIPITVTVEQASQTIAVATGSKSEFVLDYGDTTTTILTGGKASYADNISISKDGVVRVSIRGSNSDELFIEAIGSGTAEIEVFASGEDRNYKQSNTLTITVKVNKAVQKLTASPSTFSLTYNDTTTSALTTTASSFTGEGKYVVSNNTNIVTTDIDPKSDLLSLRAVGVTDTTVTITITKQQDIRYEAATIEIAIRVIRADQPLASSVIGRLSFDKPGDTTTVTISDGLSGGVYKAISDNEAIVRAAITAGSLTITAVATGDTIVRIARATGDNYNAADLTIAVRVKKQQTLSSVGAVSSFKYKYNEYQSVVTITGGQGTGLYQASYNPAGIVTTDVDANGALSITTVGVGDTTIDIYKANDESYSQSNTISLSLNVARGVVPLDYATTDTTIEYHPTNRVKIDRTLSVVTLEPSTNFEYTYTTSDNIAVNGGAKIEVILDTANNVVVSTLNADDATAKITITRARTPYYEQATADVSVRVIRATLAITYGEDVVSGATLQFDYNDALAVFNIIDAPQGAVSYELTPANDNATIDTATGSLTVTPLFLGSIAQRITRVENNNYNSQTFDFTIDVNKADPTLGYNSLSGELYLGGPDVTAGITAEIPTSDRGQRLGSFTIRSVVGVGSASVDARINPKTGELTITPVASGDVAIKVNRTGNMNYLASSVTETYRVKNSQILEYDDLTIALKSGAQTIQPSFVRLSSSTPVAIVSATPSTLKSNIELSIAADGALTITPSGAVTGDVTISITNASDDDYVPLNTVVELKVRILPLEILSQTHGYSSAYNGGTTNDVALDYTGIVVSTLELSRTINPPPSFSASSSNAATAAVIVDAQTGKLTITAEGEGTVIVTVIADNYRDGAVLNRAVLKLSVTVSNLQLTRIGNTSYGLLLTTAIVDATTYLFIAGTDIDVRAVSETRLYDSGDGVGVAEGISNVNVDSIHSSKIGEITYIFTSKSNTHTVTVYSVGSGGALTQVYATSDISRLNGASALATATVDSKTFLFVAATNMSAVSVFEVKADGSLIYKTTKTDTAQSYLDAVHSVATANTGVKTLLFVAGTSGISSFQVASDGTLSQGTTTLNRAINNIGSITTLTTEQDIFLFAVGNEVYRYKTSTPADGLIKVISIQNSFSSTAKIAGKNFLFVGSTESLNVREVQDNGALMDGLGSGAIAIQDTVDGFITATIEGKLFLFVPDETGVSVYEVK